MQKEIQKTLDLQLGKSLQKMPRLFRLIFVQENSYNKNQQELSTQNFTVHLLRRYSLLKNLFPVQ